MIGCASVACVRDFLDLKAEAICSKALAAFGDADSAPESSSHIPLDEFALLADREAAALDLVELELRQAVRAEQQFTEGETQLGYANRFVAALC